jgi:ligand-binding sensor domain-containing protein
VWIGTQNQGVYSYNRKGEFRFDPLINNNIPNLVVTAMDIDPDNNLWVGTLDGLVYYEIDQQRVDRLTQVNGLPGNEISSVFADSENRIWIGSAGLGITRISGSTFEPMELEHEFTPTCFVEDLDGMIWIGTGGRGLFLFDPDRNAWWRILPWKAVCWPT